MADESPEKAVEDRTIEFADFGDDNKEIDYGRGSATEIEGTEAIQEEEEDIDPDFEKNQDEIAQKLDDISRKIRRVTSMMDIVRRGTFDSFLDDSDLESEDGSQVNLESRGTRGGDLKAMLSDFAELPDLNTMTLNDSLKTLVPEPAATKKVEVKSEKKKDKGHFVDPITGESIHSIEPEVEEEETIEEEDEQSCSEEEEKNLFYTAEQDDDLLDVINKLDEQDMLLAPKPILEQDDEAMANFFEEIQLVPEKELKESNSELFRQMVYFEQQKKLTKDFLNALITRVVNMVEFKDEKEVLRKNLDKGKLVAKILEYLSDLRYSKGHSNFLNLKVVEYFRRRKLFRNIVEGNVDQTKDDKEKYHARLAQLDSVLGYEKNAKLNKTFIETKLQNRLQELNGMVSVAFEDFENLIRRAFIRSDASEKYVTVINNLIKKLRREREEVTDFRKNLILRQSFIAELHEQLAKIENLGEGLSLSEYNHKLTETIGLTKLLDEREHQTGVMRKRCHDALHTVTHMVENISMEKASVKIEYEALIAAKQKERSLREKMYRLKLERIQILQETATVQEVGGLISKPAVLMDYDRISECIPTIRERIMKLHKTHAKLSERVNILSEKCDNYNL